jgi:hypothetical protein
MFPRLLKKGPAYAKASAGRQMQVEPRGIPLLRELAKSLVGNAYMRSLPRYVAMTKDEETPQMAIFQQPAKVLGSLR